MSVIIDELNVKALLIDLIFVAMISSLSAFFLAGFTALTFLRTNIRLSRQKRFRRTRILLSSVIALLVFIVIYGVIDAFTSEVEEKVEKFLGILFKFNDDGSIHLHSASTIQRVLDHFKFQDCRPATTPMPPGTVLSKEMCPSMDDEKQTMVSKPYRELIGTLLYLANTTRPDISGFRWNPVAFHGKPR